MLLWLERSNPCTRSTFFIWFNRYIQQCFLLFWYYNSVGKVTPRTSRFCPTPNSKEMATMQCLNTGALHFFRLFLFHFFNRPPFIITMFFINKKGYSCLHHLVNCSHVSRFTVKQYEIITSITIFVQCMKNKQNSANNYYSAWKTNSSGTKALKIPFIFETRVMGRALVLILVVC